MMRALMIQAGLVALALVFFAPETQAQGVDPRLPRMFYYPYHYFPHNYWPNTGPKGPEQPGQRPKVVRFHKGGLCSIRDSVENSTLPLPGRGK